MKVDRRRTIRYLVITISAVCLLACVLLIVFWVRSSRMNEFIGWRVSSHRSFGMQSLLGRLSVATWKNVAETPSWWIHSEQLNDVTKSGRYENAIGFGIAYLHTNVEVIIPHWFLVLLAAALAAAPWIRWRFSLRTLIIGMTLVAVVLGVVMYLTS